MITILQIAGADVTLRSNNSGDDVDGDRTGSKLRTGCRLAPMCANPAQNALKQARDPSPGYAES
jgi:hypothetical protein